MNTAWRRQILLLTLCLAINMLPRLVTSNYPEQVAIAHQTPPPEGLVYLDSCDGRPTDQLGESAEICLADYPGEFANGVVFMGSIGLFIFVNILLGSRRIFVGPKAEDHFS